ncbi:MAG: zinc-ribbon domain-containing protein [Clostridia bacterium]|nr:zinc-ribbon domain-containing protein [Clostridia bacterium]
MAFCSKCGQKNDDNSRFCNSCGAPLFNDGPANSPASDYVSNTYGQRMKEMSLMDQLIAWFSQKNPQYDEYDEVGERIYRYEGGARKGLLVWGIIFSAIAFLSGFYGVIAKITKNEAGTTLLFIAFLLMIPGSIMLISFIVKSSKYKRIYNKSLARYEELTNELVTYYNQYVAANGFCPVGFEYTNPAVLGVIKGVMQGGRADTIKESIKTLEQDDHYQNMELISMQTAMSAQSAARNAGVAAVFSAASFFLK